MHRLISARTCLVLAATLVVWTWCASAGASAETNSLARLVAQSGVAGGVLVHVGCGTAAQAADLTLNGRFLVQGLERDPAKVVAARARIQATGRYGNVSIAQLAGSTLPYTKDLVNVLVDESGGKVAPREILRVLAPGGIAFVRASANSGATALAHSTKVLQAAGFTGVHQVGDWLRATKPWPKDIDQWTHFLHGPDNNAVAHDTRIDIPRSIQWVAQPRWGRTHEGMAGVSAVVTANGRVYYVIDEGPLASIRFAGNWKLVARDAFNGRLLWKRPMHGWVDPIRHFRSGPAHLPRRLVAVGDNVFVTLGLADPVVMLDGKTGKEIRTFAGTAYTEEIAVDQGTLFVVAGSSEQNRRGGGLFARGEPKPAHFRRILAMDTDTGQQIWMRDCTKEFVMPLTLAVSAGQVYYQSSVGVVCLDSATGTERWQTKHATPAQRMAFSAPTLVATPEVVLLADREVAPDGKVGPAQGPILWGVNGWNEPGFARKSKSKLRAYAATNGAELWSVDCTEGYNSPVDLFVVGNVVWVGSKFVGVDLKTGKTVKQLDLKAPRVGMAHHRCYRDKATDRFILTGKSGIEVIGLEEQRWLTNNSWVRGTCAYGIMPANGFIYAPPDACACFLTVKTPGFFAAAPRRESTIGMSVPKTPLVEKGPAFADADWATSSTPADDDWPAYRHDATRSGSTSTALPQRPVPLWNLKLGGRLTQPVIAGNTVYVASIDQHTLYAMELARGRERWRMVADARIDSAPTVYRGHVYFGTTGGWVYCLDAGTGQLTWRFHAAPATRLVTAYGQLESTWPVHGAVLIQNDTLYVAAGRSTYLDGGIVLYALDPESGQPRSHQVVTQLDPQTDQQTVSESRFNMEGTTNDVLSGNGDLVFLKYFTFDRDAQRTKASAPHLFSITSLLGEEWFVRSYWLVGQGMPGAGWGGWADAAHQFPAGRILCFDSKLVYGYGRTTVQGGPVGHEADAYQLFCADRSAKPVVTETAVSRRGKKTKQKRVKFQKSAPRWSQQQPLIVRAMVAGRDCLAVVGPIDVGKKDPDPHMLAYENPAEALAAFYGKKTIQLRIIAKADGKSRYTLELPSLPVFDGMSAARGRLLISLKNGSITCFGPNPSS